MSRPNPRATLAILALCAALAARAEDREAPRDLKSALGQIVAASALSGSRAGMMVISLESGQVLYAHGADELLNPASNVKLFTSAAALARLGPDHRFDTEFYVEPPNGGPTVKALYVRGKGDPSLTTERLWALAGDLLHQGLRTVKGDLVLDDGYFDTQREGAGFDQERGDRAYLAPTGALSLNFNAVAIHVAPGGRAGERGRVEIEPASDFFVVENRTQTVRASARRRVQPASIAAGDRQRIVVTGRIPLGSRDQVFYRKIDNPPLYFGQTLKRLLELRGVKIAGKVRTGAVPGGAKLFFVAESESLGEIVRRLEKTSNNFIAEQLLKALGAEVKGPPGSWPKGIEAAEDFLAEAGIPRGSFVMKNGSGLNDSNRFSARQTVTLLREMWKRFPVMAEYLSALPVAGRDGTIRWRMEGTDAAGRLRAKTGTLDNVTSLSGYVETRGHERIAFAVLVNDYPGRAAGVVRAVDAIGAAIAAAGGAPSELGAAVASASAPPPAEGAAALADLEAHVATYAKLGQAGDRRNIPFLRTALRTEQDPVLRMAAGEAIYLSDPDNEVARRTFLENLVTDGSSFPRLRAIAAKLDVQLPILSSLGDLAAEGLPEALARLVEIAPAAASDGGLLDTFADTCAEVARTAPDELLVALAAAPGPAADAAVTYIARGIARARDGEHPFPAAVKQAAGGADAALAGYARALAPKLDERMRAAEAASRAPAIQAIPAVAPAPPNGVAETRKGGG